MGPLHNWAQTKCLHEAQNEPRSNLSVTDLMTAGNQGRRSSATVLDFEDGSRTTIVAVASKKSGLGLGLENAGLHRRNFVCDGGDSHHAPLSEVVVRSHHRHIHRVLARESYFSCYQKRSVASVEFVPRRTRMHIFIQKYHFFLRRSSLSKRIVFFLLPEAFCGLKHAENAIAARASPWIPLGELTTLVTTIVGWGGDTPPHTRPHSSPLARRCSRLRRLDRRAP